MGGATREERDIADNVALERFSGPQKAGTETGGK